MSFLTALLVSIPSGSNHLAKGDEMKLAALKASLALWKRRYAARLRLRKKAREDLAAAGPKPPAKLVDRKILREQQTEQARKMVERRRTQIAAKSKVVAAPLSPILASSWGYNPPVHDGVDLICEPQATLYAICDAKVVRADASGWWGKGAHASGGHPVSDGDGIIVLRSLVDAGPFKKGLNFCYGHAEHAKVKAGDTVKAGQVIGKAGFANAWHTHFMVNNNANDRGVGDRDPMPYVNYARGKR